MRSKGATTAIIGGSGLYEMDGLANVDFLEIDTPFGEPSDAIVLGELEGQSIAFLPRHGRGHRINPSHIPVRANIYALKTLGVERIISVSAVGSLKEEFAPQDLVVPDQLIDRTRQRSNSFFDEGMVVHVGFAEPYCQVTSQAILNAARGMDLTAHSGGTMVVMEGPAFSTRAESFMYRSWGADIIGMTALPEAKLAREAEMCYATMAWITDYDCWREATETVTVEMVVQNLMANVAHSKELIHRVVTNLNAERTCECASALKDAIITRPQGIPEAIKLKLAPIVGRYMS